MLFYTIIFALLLLATFIVPFLLNNSKKDMLSKRKEQSKDILRENILKKKLEKFTEERVKFSKRYKVETMCLQAGFKLSYDEVLLFKLGSALVLAIVVGALMHNPLMGFLFFFIGFFIPNQVISMIRNRRIALMEKQIGSFMQMVIKRYEATKDFAKAMELTMVEFRGEEPMYSEIKQTVLEIRLGLPVSEAMDNMARRTGNKYMARLSDYYKIASSLGTEEIRKRLLTQAFTQFEENRRAKMQMKKELSEPVREAYIMMGSIPLFAMYQVMTNKDYVHFMTMTTTGRIGTAVISTIFVLCLWFVNAKIGAPLE